MRPAIGVVVLVALAGCPSPPGRPCRASGDCHAGETCDFQGGTQGVCRAVPPGAHDAGVVVDLDAGTVVVDAGTRTDAGTVVDAGTTTDAGTVVVDGGLTLFGGVDVGASTMRAGTRTLSGHIVVDGPTLQHASTRTLERR